MSYLYFLGGAVGTAGNWSTGSVITTGDSATLDARMTTGLVGANQSAIVLASLDIAAQPQTVASSGTPWQVGASAVSINRPPSGGAATEGPQAVCLDLGTSAFAGTVYNTPSQGISGSEPVQIVGNSAASTLICLGGRTGMATMTPGQSGTFGTLAAQGAAVVNVGAAATLGTLELKDTATVNLAGAITTANVRGGLLVVSSAAVTPTINLTGGAIVRLLSRISGNEITNLTVGVGGGTLDLSSDPRSVQIGTLTLGGTLTVKVATDANQLTWSLMQFTASASPAGIVFQR